MTPDKAHPLRCETCKHLTVGNCFDKCKNEIFPDHMDSAERQYIKDWIQDHGCASHSSAGTQQRIDKEDVEAAFRAGQYDGRDKAQQRIEQAIKELDYIDRCSTPQPLKEYSSDFDRGFVQAMTLVKGWIRDRKIALLQAGDQQHDR